MGAQSDGPAARGLHEPRTRSSSSSSSSSAQSLTRRRKCNEFEAELYQLRSEDDDDDDDDQQEARHFPARRKRTKTRRTRRADELDEGNSIPSQPNVKKVRSKLHQAQATTKASQKGGRASRLPRSSFHRDTTHSQVPQRLERDKLICASASVSASGVASGIAARSNQNATRTANKTKTGRCSCEGSLALSFRHPRHLQQGAADGALQASRSARKGNDQQVPSAPAALASRRQRQLESRERPNVNLLTRKGLSNVMTRRPELQKWRSLHQMGVGGGALLWLFLYCCSQFALPGGVFSSNAKPVVQLVHCGTLASPAIVAHKQQPPTVLSNAAKPRELFEVADRRERRRASRSKRQASDDKPPTSRRHIKPAATAKDSKRPLALSLHVLCEPISQLNDLKLACPHEHQFIVILEAYYSDLYPEIVCPRALAQEQLSGGANSKQLTPKQLVDLFRQLYSPKSPASFSSSGSSTIKLNPTLTAYSSQQQSQQQQQQRLFCLDFDLKQSLQAKCSGRQRCRFNRHQDHQFPTCAQLKPGHVFARYLCVDEALLVRYCNADAQLGSHANFGLERARRQDEGLVRAEGGPRGAATVPQIDSLDFGFVVSPGYPNFYATPSTSKPDPTLFPAGQSGTQSDCSWRIEAELGQRVTVKLLDASLAPNQLVGSRGAPLDPLLVEAQQDEFAASSSSGGGQFDQYSNLIPTSMATATEANSWSTSVSRSLSRQYMNTTNVLFEQQRIQSAASNNKNLRDLNLLNSLNINANPKKIVFKIDQPDYESIRLNVAAKLVQVGSQCSGYDQLVVREIQDGSPPPGETTLTLETRPNVRDQEEDHPGAKKEQEQELIQKLPISLYRNHLIDFRNETIFRDENGHKSSRIDYKALIDSLNPLQLVWLYQHNVSLCSISQLEQLSPPLDRNRLSFTSASNKIQLDLVSGRVFNPTNRGLLFWYHKHGCRHTRVPPKRSKLLFRNETHEVFKCLEGFVFSDTQSSLRVRECNLDQQVWQDVASSPAASPLAALDHHNKTDGPRRGTMQEIHCVYFEDLARSGLEAGSKFDRLVAPNHHSHQAGSLQSTQTRPILREEQEDEGQNEVAVEVVGTAPKPSTDTVDFDLLTPPDVSSSKQEPNSVGDLFRQFLEFVTLQTSSPSEGTGPSREVLTHQQQKSSPSQVGWLEAVRSLFDRRLLVPALAVLFLFLVLNLVIYVIFLVALPKCARCLCGNSHCLGANSRAPKSPGSRSSSRCKLTQQQQQQQQQGRKSKWGHYESDYSVSMGMSL